MSSKEIGDLEGSKIVHTFSFVQGENKPKPERTKKSLEESIPMGKSEESSTPSQRFTLSEGTSLNLTRRIVSSVQSSATAIFNLSHHFLEVIKTGVLSKIPLCVFIAEVLVTNLIMVLSAPVILLWILVILLIRQVVTLYLTARYKDKFRLMNGADAAWGSKWYANDNCFMSLYVIEGECDLQKIRRRIFNNFINRTIPGSSGPVGKYVYEKMRTKIVQKCGFYCWEKHPEFDISDHVKLARNDPSLVMTETDVFSEIQSWVDKPLPSNLPQWEIVVVPKFVYLSKGQCDPKKSYYGLIWRINHSIMDGISAVSALQNFIAEDPVPMTIDPLAPTGVPWYFQLLMYLQILILGARSFIKTMFTKDSNCFHGPNLTGPKHLIWSKPIKVQTLKQLKNTLNSSTTAVLLSAVGGALKSLAENKGLPVPREVIGGATCAVIPYDGIGPQNRFTVASFNLAVDEESSQERLIKASYSVKQLGSGAEILKNFNMIRLTGLNPAAWIAKLMNNLQASFLLSNVPGPKECYKIFGNDTLVDVIAWNTIKGRTAIGICLLSYGGKMRTGFIVDSAVLPDAQDTSDLAENFENEIVKLANICGIPKELVFHDIFY